MTEGEKLHALAGLEERALAAERCGMKRTAKLWREYAANVRARPAGEMVLSEKSPLRTGIPADDHAPHGLRE